jgi:hypothetical protein
LRTYGLTTSLNILNSPKSSIVFSPQAYEKPFRYETGLDEQGSSPSLLRQEKMKKTVGKLPLNPQTQKLTTSLKTNYPPPKGEEDFC